MPNSTTQPTAPSSYRAFSPYVANEEGSIQATVEKSIAGLEDFARREPMTFAAYVFGVGFILGWKLKPW